MLSVYWTWIPALVCLSVSTALLVRLELRDAAGRPWPHRLAHPLPAASTIEYIIMAVVLITAIFAGFQAFGDAAQQAFTDLGEWVTDSIGNIGDGGGGGGGGEGG